MFARGMIALLGMALLCGCSMFGGKKEEPAPRPPATADNRLDLIEESVKQNRRDIEDVRRQVSALSDRLAQGGGRETVPTTYPRSVPTAGQDPVGSYGEAGPSAGAAQPGPVPGARGAGAGAGGGSPKGAAGTARGAGSSGAAAGAAGGAGTGHEPGAKGGSSSAYNALTGGGDAAGPGAGAGAARGSVPPVGAGKSAGPAVPQISDAATQEKVSQLLQRFQTDKDGKAVAAGLRPYSRFVAPTFVGYLRDFTYQSAAIDVLATLEPRDVLPLISDALKREVDPQLQVACVRVLGRVGDNSAVPALRDCVRTDNSDLKFYTAEALVLLKSKDGIPVLISYLKSPEETKRAIAYSGLRSATGYSFGYKLWSTRSEEWEEGYRRWKEWWDTSGAAFQFK
ncbi:MAG: HEAT repeat domain-containing protein [Planctomycetes bacterium]|nr:HEAT repeat domain-containing protein [Planctomycetota bacterium]